MGAYNRLFYKNLKVFNYSVKDFDANNSESIFS